MQFFRNSVLSVPTSFLVLASLRHAVRLACFAAASAEGGADAAFAAGGALALAAAVPGTSAAGADGAAANAPAAGSRQRHTAAATAEKRKVISIEDSNDAHQSRITLTRIRTDEARMKLA
jgi:hypothetical protein